MQRCRSSVDAFEKKRRQTSHVHSHLRPCLFTSCRKRSCWREKCASQFGYSHFSAVRFGRVTGRIFEVGYVVAERERCSFGGWMEERAPGPMRSSGEYANVVSESDSCVQDDAEDGGDGNSSKEGR